MIWAAPLRRGPLFSIPHYMNQKQVRAIIHICLILIFAACSHTPSEPLLNVFKLSDSAPEAALDSLRSIYPESLSVNDRHFYDLLTVKLTDKTYGAHASDSLINDVIKYAADNWDAMLKAEALYYGGRVNSDLHNYHAALRFYHDALDALPQSHDSLELKSRILSQTGRLLNTLRLYKEAIPYIKETIEIDSILHDTINTVYDLQLLGGIYLRSDDLIDAENCFNKALALDNNLPSTFNARSRMYLGAVMFERNLNDSALIYIRNTPDKISKLERNSALAYASKIYAKAGFLDTAYNYSINILHSNDLSQKEIAFNILLSSKFQQFVDIDSLYQYANDYTRIIEDRFNSNESQFAIIQQAAYNYDIHDRNRAIAEKRANRFLYWIVISLIIIFALIIFILIKKNHHNRTIIQLQQARQYIHNLESEKEDNIPNVKLDSPSSIRQQLKADLLNLYNSKESDTSVARCIIQSESYQQLQTLIAMESELKPDSKLWTELEATIQQCSPKFLSTLQLLANGKLTRTDLRTAILIKFGISPSQMAVLLNRTKGTISSRRESLCRKIFDENLGLKTIDGVIRLL